MDGPQPRDPGPRGRILLGSAQCTKAVPGDSTYGKPLISAV